MGEWLPLLANPEAEFLWQLVPRSILRVDAQKCATMESVTGAGPTVSCWGGVTTKHTEPKHTPKPEDREAGLPPSWSEGNDVRDILIPQELATQLCLPNVQRDDWAREMEKPPKRKLVMRDLAITADSLATGTR